MRSIAGVILVTTLVARAAGATSGPPPGLETLSIRGQPQTLRVYGPPGGRPTIVASGDGGWVHVGPLVAEFLGEQGYRVLGLDSRAYLSAFTRGGTTLSPGDVPRDFGALVDRGAGGRARATLLVGVSEGAGLAVLAATDAALKARLSGVVGLGLPDRSELGWRFSDSIIYLTKGIPKEPLFSAAEIIGSVAPLPVAAIHSSQDEYVPLSEVESVLARAGEPKRLWVIPARNHRFGGSEAELKQRLLEAIAWIDGARR